MFNHRSARLNEKNHSELHECSNLNEYSLLKEKTKLEYDCERKMTRKLEGSSDDEGGKKNKKKENAKEVKRLREQNRRASHKEFVCGLQKLIKEKEEKIELCELRIKELEKQIEGQVCQKCGENKMCNEFFTLLPEKEEYKNSESEDFEEMSSFNRIMSDDNFNCNFGSKHLFFFVVIMCCLTFGSIADNPEIFLEPIIPYRVKSSLVQFDQIKLSKIEVKSVLMINKEFSHKHAIKIQIKSIFERLTSKLKKMLKGTADTIKLFSFVESYKLVEQSLKDILISFSSYLKDPNQIAKDIMAQVMFTRMDPGRNYYM